MSGLLDWLEDERENARAAKARCEREGYRLSFIAYEGEINALTRVICHIREDRQ